MTEAMLQSAPAVPPIRSFAKRARSTAGYVFLVAVMFIAAPLAILMPAALLHCGIRNGRRAAWIVLAAAAAIAVLLMLPAAVAPATPARAVHSAISYHLGLVLMIGLPAVLVLPMVERGERFGRVLLFALLIGAGGMMATQLIMQVAASYSPYAEQVETLRKWFAGFIDANVKDGVAADTIHQLRRAANLTLYVEPASLLIYATLTFILSLVTLGRLPAWRQLVARRALPSATPYLFCQLALPEWLLFAFVIGGVSPLFSGFPQKIGANVLAVVVFLYFLQGLAIFRFVVGNATGILALFAWATLGLLMITGVAQLLLAVAGLFDSFFDFRHLNRKDHPDESHSH